MSHRRSKTAHAVLAAIEREQQRFASELHDGVCQELTGIAFTLDALKRAANPDVAETLQQTSDHVRRLASDVKRLALGLAPLALESTGLLGALKLLQREINSAAGCELELKLDDLLIDQLPREVALNLYRIAQEATMNALRHAGASRLVIRLCQKDTGVEFSVEDNGCGVDESHGKPGLGIYSMMWRAEWLGTDLTVLPNLPVGTRIVLFLNQALEPHGISASS